MMNSQQEENDREPTHRELRTDCPQCDHDGALDGQGPFNRELRRLRLADDGVQQTIERWYQMQCPECETVFAIRERVVNHPVDEEGDDDA